MQPGRVPSLRRRLILPLAAIFCLSVTVLGASRPDGARGGQSLAGKTQDVSLVLTLEKLRSVPRFQLDVIADYEWALAAALSVVERELHFPRLEADVCFFRHDAALRTVLLAEGHEHSTADCAAETMSGVSSPGTIRINTKAMYALTWPARVVVLAHELTHIAQYQLAGGRRGTSEQWLREGMAEWVGLRVLEAMGRGRVSTGVRQARENLKLAAQSKPLPRFGALVTFPSWVELSRKSSNRPLYDMSLVAAADLIERHGLDELLHYFARYAGSDDRSVNFWLSFGEDPAAFEARLDESTRR